MARTKTFRHDEALAGAMNAFWRQGYVATSVQDLVDATGLNRASLYAAFGGKRALFLEAVEHYGALFQENGLAILERPGSPVAAIRALFDALIALYVEDRPRWGCLITNSAVELSPHDRAAGTLVSQGIDRVEKALERALERARAAGEIAPERDVRSLARYLTSSLQGIVVLSKTARGGDELKDIAEVALSVLERRHPGPEAPGVGRISAAGGRA